MAVQLKGGNAMKRLVLRFPVTIAALMLVASCATTVRHEGEIKQCSDTPRNAVARWFRGVAEMSITVLHALIPDGASIFDVFDNGGKRGQEIVRQILANPVSGARGGCACTLLSPPTDDPSDPHVKIVTVKRVVEVGDDDYIFKRAFRVRFDSRGNCILGIDSIDPKWERIETE
ncbi:MAG: hypothetical protein Q8L52_02920 [bacterium]|nr:hypothetical protein [bacterium]